MIRPASDGRPILFDAIELRLLPNPGLQVAYNARGRLVAAGSAQYVVNALGQRIIKTYQGQTTLCHYDRQGHLIAESDELGNTKSEYIYLYDTPIAVIDFGAVRYIHTDHLGTARLVTDATKRPIWAWQGEPFGNSAPNEDPEATGGAYALNLRLPGQYYDKETGLYYNGYRDYDPATGRYIQSDPIGLVGGLNTYAYVMGNPLSGVDPLGLYVHAVYSRNSGILNVTDLDTGKSVSTNAFTGGQFVTKKPYRQFVSRPEEKIPTIGYDILGTRRGDWLSLIHEIIFRRMMPILDHGAMLSVCIQVQIALAALRLTRRTI